MAKILVVDDEKDIVEFFGRILCREGFEVLTASSGEDCLNLAETGCPDLILLDINMPGMDGGDVSYFLEKNEKTSNIPIIFLSALVTKEEGGSIKGRLFISKSIGKEEIIKKIKNVLGLTS